MPIIYPGNVPNWQELSCSPDLENVLAIHDAVRLLVQSFPGRYEKYSVLALRRKMARRPIGNERVPGLRVWTHTIATQEISVFFFLRNRGPKTPSYAMSIGLDPNAGNATQVYDALLPLCSFMTTQVAEGLEIVNDLGAPAQGNAVLTEVITHANSQATEGREKVAADGIVDPGDPWPPDLNRWVVDPNA